MTAEHRAKISATLRERADRRRRGLPPIAAKPKSPIAARRGRPPREPDDASQISLFIPYKKVTAAAVERRGRWRAALVVDDGKGGRTRRTGRRSFATSPEAHAAALRMLRRAERAS